MSDLVKRLHEWGRHKSEWLEVRPSALREAAAEIERLEARVAQAEGERRAVEISRDAWRNNAEAAEARIAKLAVVAKGAYCVDQKMTVQECVEGGYCECEALAALQPKGEQT